MIILAIDPSISSSGYCVITDKKEILKYGKVATNKKDFKSEDDRINHICNIFDNIVNKYKVNEVVMESQFVGNNVKTGMTLKKLTGALARTFKDLTPVSYVMPSAWRKALLQSSKPVKKEDVFKWVEANIEGLGKVVSKGVNKTDDVAESISIAHAYINDKENIVKKSLY